LERDRFIPFAVRLRDRAQVVGTVLTVPSVALAELVGARVDFVWIDLEHGALDVGDVQPLAVGAQAAGAAALVRLPDAGAGRLSAILDAGVDGIVAPRTESAKQASRLVEALRHPPRGSRGFAARRASGYEAGAPADAEAGADPLCWLQIESPAGVDAAGEIAAVEGVHALIVGCADLALNSGGALDPQAVAHVQAAARAHGIASGIAGPDDPTSGGVTALAGRLIAAGHVIRRDHPNDRRMRVLTITEEGEQHIADRMAPVLMPADRLFEWLSEDDEKLLSRFLGSLAALKEHAAATTPGPEPERAGEPYSPALLM
jgi:4-hydroxy-2-oxoheptanedioate aldolase